MLLIVFLNFLNLDRLQRSLKTVHLGSGTVGALKFSLCFLLEMGGQLNLCTLRLLPSKLFYSFVLIKIARLEKLMVSNLFADICTYYLSSCTGLLDTEIHNHLREW